MDSEGLDQTEGNAHLWSGPLESAYAQSQVNPLNPSPAEPRYVLPLQTVDPDQLASEEANWSGSALFAN